MRLAALAFGILAGLVASLVLALGGLDVDLLSIDQRQLSAVRFGLFVVANLGIFGAGLVLAAPLAAAAIFALGALSWIGAAILLHHGPDMVMLVPPALLLVAGAVSLVTGLRSRTLAPLPPLRQQERRAEIEPIEDLEEIDEPANRRRGPSPEPYEELPPISVGAGFFGEGGTAMPLRVSEPNVRTIDNEADEADQDDEPAPKPRQVDDWRPGRKRAPPPRTQSVFREIETDDDEDEEGGFARFARGVSTLLSFGLYAALAGAAILVFFNLRTANTDATATKVEVSSSAVRSTAASSTAPATSTPAAVAKLPDLASAPPALPSLVAAASSEIADVAASSGLQNFPGLVVMSEPDAAPAATSSVAAPTDAPSVPSIAASEEPASVAPDVTPPDNTLADPNAVMPWPVPAQLAAERAKPAPKRPVQNTAPAAPAVDTTGL